MEIIKDVIHKPIYIPESLIEKFNNKKFCFFDIETTGLKRSSNKIILIGLLYNKDNYTVIKQFFADNLSEEKDILASFIEEALNFDIFITYNGNTFDIPFINERCDKYGYDFKISKEKSLDLLKIVRKNKDLLNLQNCKLKSVELSLGIKREDKISGKESIKMYFDYIKNKNSNLKEIILKHNYDDIYYLPKILKVFDHIENQNKLLIPIHVNLKKVKLELNLSNLKFNNEMISIKGHTNCFDFPEQIYYGSNYMLEWKPKIGDLQLKLQTYKGKLSNGKKCFYINKEDYDFNISCYDKSNYNVPDKIILVKEGKNLVINNIKNLVSEIVKNIIK
ncbi:ribonuclease H-like domain-containing protein [Thermohalobacter berrensis]|uniref:YprB ribonuclease H-like domain-containing protein n=1 Tax=Thermohalobacter berrensis TaxID=99594 RepID=A0A419T5A6_9FIRM|nr:ribonuclease H-like domain-containing protein [Thermohalobacter berrensis]RKD32710.1 hypothetical protein BET03_10255 [Thermohalobacter berrensis]